MHKSAARDLLLIGVAGLLFWYAGIRTDAMDTAVAFMEAHESWELDEIAFAIVTLGLFGFVFALRRYLEMRSEVRRREKAEYDASWLASHDPLTRLPNRRHLEEFFELPRRHDDDVVFALDLDGFKRVNDLLGHAAGDQVLVIAADRLRRIFPSALVVRQGGDEFLVLTSKIATPLPMTTALEAIGLLSEPINIGGTQVQIGACIGIAVTDETVSRENLVAHADIALYVAKGTGRNTAKIFNAAMLEYSTQRASMEQDLRSAIRNQTIVPHFQPLTDLQSGRLVGFEALARWKRDNGTMTPPDVFIALAEQAGLISELSDHLLLEASRVALTWPGDLILSFNVSPTQMSDKLLARRILDVLARTGLPPSRLEIEITESAVVRELETATEIISELRNAGVQVALDDFGTGFSSLSQLGNLSFDRLKVDRSFVTSCERDPKRLKIIKAILSLGQGLGLHTTAEGIENTKQLDLMREMGCETGQGYLFSAALPASELAQLLAENLKVRELPRSVVLQLV